jgi:hypothetical protein
MKEKISEQQEEFTKSIAIGFWLVLSYVLYWPSVYLMRAGAEWSNVLVDWGPPQLVAGMWFLAPILTPLNLFVSFLYWVLCPMVEFIAWVFL